MRTYAKLFCLALPIMIALNMSWFWVIATGFYQSQFGAFFHPQHMVLWAATLFSILYTLGLIYFSLRPALATRSLSLAVVNGAVLGFIANMTYDVSNLATLADWPLFGSAIDVVWGTLMSAITAGLTYLIAANVFKM